MRSGGVRGGEDDWLSERKRGWNGSKVEGFSTSNCGPWLGMNMSGDGESPNAVWRGGRWGNLEAGVGVVG